jgi:hypothetical protein
MAASAPKWTIDGREILVRIVKYIVEGAVVALAAFLIPAKKPDVWETVTIALIAAATFSLLDMFAPSIGAAARQGVGLGTGFNLVKFPGGF